MCDHSIMSPLLPFHSESHYHFKEVRHLIESTPNLLEVAWGVGQGDSRHIVPDRSIC